jgi:hypothetical protein
MIKPELIPRPVVHQETLIIHLIIKADITKDIKTTAMVNITTGPHIRKAKTPLKAITEAIQGLMVGKTKGIDKIL